MEELIHMRTLLQQRTKDQGRVPTNGGVNFLKENISKRTRAIVGHYYDDIKEYLRARVRFFKTRVLNEIKQ